MNTALIASVGLLAAAAWYVTRNAGQDTEQAGADIPETGGVLREAAQGTLEIIDTITGGQMKLSAMAQVTREQLQHPNVQAFLKVIRRGEGTLDADGYRRIFGGQLFQSFADHPRVTVKKSGYTSSAAGAYQFIISTWDETKRIMSLPDFAPASQDMAALGRIAARGALADVLAGHFAAAIKKTAGEWASLPGSPYGQPTISMTTAYAVYTSSGGTFA